MMCFMMSGLAAFGSEWGMLEGYDSEESSTASSSVEAVRPSPAKLGRKSLLKNILTGQSVAVYLDRGFYSTGLSHNAAEQKDLISEQTYELEQQERLEQQALVQALYDQWFSYTAKTIRKAHREKEFSDILAVLDRGVSIRWVDESAKADIMFRITSLDSVQRFCGMNNVLGCYVPEAVPIIYLPFDTRIGNAKTKVGQLFNSIQVTTEEVGLHEVGHSLGLSDQYDAAADKNTDFTYSSLRQGTGIMNNICHKSFSGKCRRQLSCDDADGLINMIDITQKKRSERNDYGWKSLCLSSKEMYSYGKSSLRGPYSWQIRDINEGITLSVNHWQRSEELFFPWSNLQAPSKAFQALKETPKEYDVSGRVVRATGVNGEDIYYAYQYKAKNRLVTLQGKVLSVEISYPTYQYKKTPRSNQIRHEVAFKYENRTVTMESSYSPQKGGEMWYQQYDSFARNRMFYYAILTFDKNKHLTKLEERYYEGDDMDAKKESKSSANNALVKTGMASYSAEEKIDRAMKKAVEARKNQTLFDVMARWFQRHY